MIALVLPDLERAGNVPLAFLVAGVLFVALFVWLTRPERRP